MPPDTIGRVAAVHANGDVAVSFPIHMKDAARLPSIHSYTVDAAQLLPASVDFRGPVAAQRAALLANFETREAAKVPMTHAAGIDVPTFFWRFFVFNYLSRFD